jgi:hypothetical protein
MALMALLLAGEVATLVEATAAMPPWFSGWGLPPLQDIGILF